jgi:hypothetical protein
MSAMNSLAAASVPQTKAEEMNHKGTEKMMNHE